MTLLKGAHRGYAEATGVGIYVYELLSKLTHLRVSQWVLYLKKDERKKGRGMRPAGKESDCF